MHRHDHDIILALVEGSILGTAAAEARAEIDACDVCRADLEEQRNVLAWLQTAEPIELSELETARLKKNLDAELGHTRTHMAAAAAPARSLWSRIPMTAVVTAAAVLVGVVFVAGNLSLVGGGDDADRGAESIAFDDAAATSVARSVPEDRIESTDGGLAEPDSAAALEETTAAAEAPADTTAALSATTTAAADVAGDAAEDLDAGPLDEVLAALQDSQGDIDLAAAYLLETPTLTQFRISVPGVNCLVEGEGLVPGSLVRRAVGVLDLPGFGDAQVIGHYGPDDAVVGVSAHDITSCEPLDTVLAE